MSLSVSRKVGGEVRVPERKRERKSEGASIIEKPFPDPAGM